MERAEAAKLPTDALRLLLLGIIIQAGEVERKDEGGLYRSSIYRCKRMLIWRFSNGVENVSMNGNAYTN